MPLLHARELLARRLEAGFDVAVGIDRKQRAPASVLREPQSGVRQTMAIEADRWDIADLAPEPPLDAAGDRTLGHDDEMLGVILPGASAARST